MGLRCGSEGHDDDGDWASWGGYQVDVESWVRWLITARSRGDGRS